MHEGVQQAQRERRQEQNDVDPAQAPTRSLSSQADQAREQRESAEHEPSDDQPGSKVLPLDLVARVVRDVIEQRAEERRQRAAQQDRV